MRLDSVGVSDVASGASLAVAVSAGSLRLNVGDWAVVLIAGLGSLNVVVLMRSIDGEVGVGGVNLSSGLGSVEVHIRCVPFLLDVSGVVVVLGLVDVSLTALEGNLGLLEAELGRVLLDLGSLEGVSEDGSVGGESATVGVVVETSTLDTEMGLGAINSEVSFRSMNVVFDMGLSVGIGSVLRVGFADTVGVSAVNTTPVLAVTAKSVGFAVGANTVATVAVSVSVGVTVTGASSVEVGTIAGTVCALFTVATIAGSVTVGAATERTEALGANAGLDAVTEATDLGADSAESAEGLATVARDTSATIADSSTGGVAAIGLAVATISAKGLSVASGAIATESVSVTVAVVLASVS